nr:sensor histidine kinase [uncultured Desulfobulbus sp.]
MNDLMTDAAASKEGYSGVSTGVEQSVENALLTWRRNAVNIFMACSVLGYLPAMILMLCGQCPPIAWAVKLLLYFSYLVLVFAAFLKAVNHRLRLYAILSLAYLTAIAGVIAYPGPFIRALPVALPVIGLVLSGIRCGRITAAASALLILLTPFLSTLFPVRAKSLTIGAQSSPESFGLMLMQGTGLTAMLLALMILLELFYRFLGQALTDQHHAMNEVERKVGELTRAHASLAQEVDKRRKLEQELTRIADEEKRRLGLEIHDGVCQQITGALLRCEALALRLDRGQPASPDDVKALSTLLEEAIDEAHGVARGLCPLEAAPNAIESAIRTLTRRTQRITGIPCRLVTTGNIHIDDQIKAQHLFRIAQEAISNAVRHAGATAINVELAIAENRIVLQIIDNGHGLPEVLPTCGMGLRTMACRAHLLEGEFSVTPLPQGGTCIRCTVPHSPPSPPFA